jgi:hypothetical protein
MNASKKTYALYKGLQRPLIFKSFKGKFIYWALGAVLSGIVIGGLIAAFISSFIGIVSMATISASLLFATIHKQKKGLYTKKIQQVIFMIAPKHRIRNYESKTKI